MTPREKTHQVTAGNIKIGGGAKVSVQSMTNTRTLRRYGALLTKGAK